MKYQASLDRILILAKNYQQEAVELEKFILIEETIKRDSLILQQAIDKANKFKEKETAKPLIVDDSEYDKYSENDYLCPSCNKFLGGDTFDDFKGYKYCPYCGQMIGV